MQHAPCSKNFLPPLWLIRMVFFEDKFFLESQALTEEVVRSVSGHQFDIRLIHLNRH